LEGRLEDIYQSNAVIVDQQAIEKLSRGRSRPLALGDSFEINDREARIVAIVPAELSFTGAPNIYSTKERALDYIPRQRKMLSYVLATPQPGVTDVELAARITSQTQLKAYTEKEFFWATIWWYFKYTGIPISFGTTVTLGIIVGIVISGQTFYTFIQENMRSLGALKAMGMSNFRLVRMVLLQAFTVGFMGYGIGLGLACLYGNMSVKRGGQPPFFMPPEIPIGGAVIVLCICGFAALLGIIKVARLEPAIVFRG
jgi:putative ABC transport system permease protein